MESIRLETKVIERGGHKILELSGEIDVFTAGPFKEAIVSLLDTGTNHLFADMSKVSYMDSSGFGALLSAVKRLRSNNGTVNLIGCAGPIYRILHITKLDLVFNIHATFEDALAFVENEKPKS